MGVLEVSIVDKVHKKIDQEIKNYMKEKEIDSPFYLRDELDSKAIFEKISKQRNTELKKCVFIFYNDNEEDIIDQIINRMIILRESFKKWKTVSENIRNDLSFFIRELFQNNPEKKYFRHTIALEYSKTDYYKRHEDNFKLNDYFEFHFSPNLRAGNKLIHSLINQWKSDIRNEPNAFGDYYVVRADESIEGQKQSGWIYTDNEIKIKNELLKSGKAGTLRTLTNFKYGIIKKLIIDPNINIVDLQKIIDSINANLVYDNEEDFIY